MALRNDYTFAIPDPPNPNIIPEAWRIKIDDVPTTIHDNLVLNALRGFWDKHWYKYPDTIKASFLYAVQCVKTTPSNAQNPMRHKLSKMCVEVSNKKKVDLDWGVWLVLRKIYWDEHLSNNEKWADYQTSSRFHECAITAKIGERYFTTSNVFTAIYPERYQPRPTWWMRLTTSDLPEELVRARSHRVESERNGDDRQSLTQSQPGVPSNAYTRSSLVPIARNGSAGSPHRKGEASPADHIVVAHPLALRNRTAAQNGVTPQGPTSEQLKSSSHDFTPTRGAYAEGPENSHKRQRIDPVSTSPCSSDTVKFAADAEPDLNMKMTEQSFQGRTSENGATGKTAREDQRKALMDHLESLRRLEQHLQKQTLEISTVNQKMQEDQRVLQQSQIQLQEDQRQLITRQTELELLVQQLAEKQNESILVQQRVMKQVEELRELRGLKTLLSASSHFGAFMATLMELHKEDSPK